LTTETEQIDLSREEAQEAFDENAPRRREGWGDLGSLPVYLNPTEDGVESEWQSVERKAGEMFLRLGAIAHAVSLEGIYGDESIKKFAGRMGTAASTVGDWLATYRRLYRLDDGRRERVLALNVRYGHYRTCNGVRDDAAFERLLTDAADKNWNAGRLASEVAAYKDSLKRDHTPPDAEDADEDDEPPGAQHSPKDATSGPAAKLQTELTNFVTFLRDQGYVLAYRDDKSRLKPLKAVGQSDELLIGDYVDDRFSDVE
jgi:hypothetical protein